MTDISGLILLALAGGFVGTYAPLIKKLPRETCSDRLKHVAASIITGSIFLVMTYFLLESLRYNIINETYKYLLAFSYCANPSSVTSLIASFSSKLKQHIPF